MKSWGIAAWRAAVQVFLGDRVAHAGPVRGLTVTDGDAEVLRDALLSGNLGAAREKLVVLFGAVMHQHDSGLQAHERLLLRFVEFLALRAAQAGGPRRLGSGPAPAAAVTLSSADAAAAPRVALGVSLPLGAHSLRRRRAKQWSSPVVAVRTAHAAAPEGATTELACAQRSLSEFFASRPGSGNGGPVVDEPGLDPPVTAAAAAAALLLWLVRLFLRRAVVRCRLRA